MESEPHYATNGFTTRVPCPAGDVFWKLINLTLFRYYRLWLARNA